ncbi:MAG: SDR family NAD(P)-dependent oxidoreductase, partial [Acidimicrobiales bacterium]
MEDLSGRVAVVTGGASGIGYALAERFAGEGMGVVIADVEEAALKGAGAMLRATGADVLEVETDVRDAGQVESLAERAVAHFGAVHVVCNNAGVAGGAAGGALWDIALEDWEWTLGVNLRGVINGVRAFVPRLVAQGEGHVVNTASMAGLIAGGGGAYGVSKAGVVSLSESLYFGLQQADAGVGVSVLCPGWVNTHLADSERNRPADLAVEPAADPMASRARKGLVRVLES